jgi:hypothetical protein
MEQITAAMALLVAGGMATMDPLVVMKEISTWKTPRPKGWMYVLASFVFIVISAALSVQRNGSVHRDMDIWLTPVAELESDVTW